MRKSKALTGKILFPIKSVTFSVEARKRNIATIKASDAGQFTFALLRREEANEEMIEDLRAKAPGTRSRLRWV